MACPVHSSWMPSTPSYWAQTNVPDAIHLVKWKRSLVSLTMTATCSALEGQNLTLIGQNYWHDSTQWSPFLLLEVDRPRNAQHLIGELITITTPKLTLVTGCLYLLVTYSYIKILDSKVIVSRREASRGTQGNSPLMKQKLVSHQPPVYHIFLLSAFILKMLLEPRWGPGSFALFIVLVHSPSANHLAFCSGNWSY